MTNSTFKTSPNSTLIVMQAQLPQIASMRRQTELPTNRIEIPEAKRISQNKIRMQKKDAKRGGSPSRV